MIESVESFLARLKKRDPDQPEFHQAVEEVLRSLWPFLEANPHYLTSGILERICEPERADRVPRVLGRRSRQGAGQSRFPYPDEQRHRSVQGRFAFPSVGEPGRPEVPRLRADLQELPDLVAHGRRQGWFGLRPQRQERRRSHALLPGLHERAVPPHRCRRRRAGR